MEPSYLIQRFEEPMLMERYTPRQGQRERQRRDRSSKPGVFFHFPENERTTTLPGVWKHYYTSPDAFQGFHFASFFSQASPPSPPALVLGWLAVRYTTTGAWLSCTASIPQWRRQFSSSTNLIKCKEVKKKGLSRTKKMSGLGKGCERTRGTTRTKRGT